MSDARGSSKVVWVGTNVPNADYPPRRVTIEAVFASESTARAWADEYNRLWAEGRIPTRRDVQRFEVQP